jgi:hypothetical protein
MIFSALINIEYLKQRAKKTLSGGCAGAKLGGFPMNRHGKLLSDNHSVRMALRKMV